MKKLIFRFLTISIVVLNNLQSAAQSVKEILNDKYIQVTWLGIDFSSVKYMGEVPSNSGESMVGLGPHFFSVHTVSGGPFVFKDQFNSMNEVIAAESEKKYNLKATFHKSGIPFNLIYANETNSKIQNDDVKEMTSSISGALLKESDIKRIVGSYKFGRDVKGVGLMFIADRLSKTIEVGIFWVVFINLDTKEIILSEQVKGKPKGFGFRNYWLGAVSDAFKNIQRKYYKEWKKKYSK